MCRIVNVLAGRMMWANLAVWLSYVSYTLAQTSPPENVSTSAPVTTSPAALCPDNLNCSLLPAHCIECSYTDSCRYGQNLIVNCASNGTVCLGDQPFLRNVSCRFCYQLDPSDYTCTNSTDCVVTRTPRPTYLSTCTVKPDVICLGSRTFSMNRTCNWSSGFRWSTALVLSITLGGFGVDRFYLGDWPNGIGKLLSFGGLGVWTLVDIILVAIGYLSPTDGSLYIT